MAAVRHDRAYVSIDGRQLGYRDLKSGEIVCDRAEHRDAVERATNDIHRRAAAAAGQSEYQPRHAAPESEPEASPVVPPEVPDRDLALNRPGEAAREQAMQRYAAAPVRTLIARAVGVKTEERSWRIGADGEEEIARRLEQLGPQWHVLSAIPVGDRGSDIDHVVIGPGGVFTINVKHHPQANVWVLGETFKVNGFNQPYVRNSRHEAQRAAKLVSAAAGFDVEVRGIVVVMGAQRGFAVKDQPRDVDVVAHKQLVEHLRARPPLLPDDVVTRIFDVARHLSTWQPKAVDRADFEPAG